MFESTEDELLSIVATSYQTAGIVLALTLFVAAIFFIAGVVGRPIGIAIQAETLLENSNIAVGVDDSTGRRTLILQKRVAQIPTAFLWFFILAYEVTDRSTAHGGYSGDFTVNVWGYLFFKAGVEAVVTLGLLSIIARAWLWYRR